MDQPDPRFPEKTEIAINADPAPSPEKVPKKYKLDVKNVRNTIRRICDENNCNPFLNLVMATSREVPLLDDKGQPAVDRKGNVIMVPFLDMKSYIKVNTELLKYIAPQLRAIDIDAKSSGNFKLMLQQFGQQAVQPLIDTIKTEIVGDEEEEDDESEGDESEAEG